ncbi:UNVERIFIED_CONTAM: hypothetical protein FKN15_051270 [Acipenser sinensis]
MNFEVVILIHLCSRCYQLFTDLKDRVVHLLTEDVKGLAAFNNTGIRSLVSADLMLIDSNMRQQMQTMREAEEEEKKKSLLCLEVVRQHGYQTAFLSCKPLLENGKDIGSVAVQQWGCNATSISCYCCSLSHILKSVTRLCSSRAAAQRLQGQ